MSTPCAATDFEELVVFLYLAGRPVAQLAIDGTGTETWTYLTADHLGTPLVATDDAAGVMWEGGFEPFGQDYQAGTPAGATENGLYLRLPGQWDDGTWSDATSGAGIYYNVHRWYQPGVGRYTRSDPLGLEEGPNLYIYASAGPTTYIDLLGLTSYEGFTPADEAVLKQGVEEARKKLKGCCAGAGDSERLLALLEKAKFVADASLLSRRFLPACGEVTLWGYLTNTIKIDPLALSDPGSSQQCCAPGGLVVHEVTHLTLGGRLGEGSAYNNEHRCFGCEGSVMMQEYLEKHPKNGGW